MSPRPFPRLGTYVQAKRPPTSVVCKGYSAPPSIRGRRLGNIQAGSYLGPIVAVEQSDIFVSVLINGWWINIWTSQGGGTLFAFPVPDEEVQSWERRGWEHRRQWT